MLTLFISLSHSSLIELVSFKSKPHRHGSESTTKTSEKASERQTTALTSFAIAPMQFVCSSSDGRPILIFSVSATLMSGSFRGPKVPGLLIYSPEESMYTGSGTSVEGPGGAPVRAIP